MFRTDVYRIKHINLKTIYIHCQDCEINEYINISWENYINEKRKKIVAIGLLSWLQWSVRNQ